MDPRISTQKLIIALVAMMSLGELNFALSASDIEFQCPDKWFNIGYMCYRIVDKAMPWDLADYSCKSLRSNLVTIDDYWTNEDISSAVKKKGHNEYWIGFNRLGTINTNQTAYWGDGSLSNTQTGFWDNYQPDVQKGKCTAVIQSGQTFKWSFAKCDMAKVFVCEMTACSKDTFRCNNGRCIGKQLLCDGNDDCWDRTDEVNCTQQCQHYQSGSTGEIKSENFPSNYNDNTFCIWRIDADIGSYIQLTFTEFITEHSTDVVDIFIGGDSESDSILLAKLSGSLPANTTYLSYNNKMLLKFTSDLNDTKKGFFATWSAVSTGYSHTMLTATQNEQILSINNYKNNLQQMWTITTQNAREIITLKKQDMLLYNNDEVIVYDGDSVTSPVLGRYESATFDTVGPDIIMSSGKNMHILLKTRGTISNGNIKFSYQQGCNAIISDALYGEIVSPGYYANMQYPNTLSCQWSMFSQASMALFFKFTADLANDDTLHVKFNNGSQILEFSAVSTPNIGVPDGQVNISFVTNAINNLRGFKAMYSVDCPDLNLNNYSIIQPSQNIWHHGSEVDISCVNGYGFRAEEFLGNKSVRLQCQFGGKWSIHKIPECLKNYCGPVKYIKNGYVSKADGVMVGDTAFYTCLPGYQITASNTIKCTSDGIWELSPACISSGCSLPSNISNGRTVFENGNGITVESVVKYICDPGYHIDGNPIQLCLKSGKWTGAEPTCKKFNCSITSLSDKIPKANITQQENVPFNETIIISCIKGYKILGSDTVRCSENQTFTMLPSCGDENECEGNHTCTQICVNTPGSCVCKCEKGYILKADNMTCEDIDECQTNNGNCQHHCSNINGSYTCSCNKGYVLYKENNTMNYTIPAAENGIEFGDVFYLNHSCVRVMCLNLLPPENGFRQPQRKISRYGDTFLYSCKIGYRLVGEKSPVCQDNGIWSGTQQRCDEMKCQLESLDAIMNKPDLLTNESIPYLGYLNFTCTIPGKNIEYRQRQCLYDPTTETTKLLGDSYECGFIDCGQPMVIGGSNITTINNTVYGSMFEMGCNDLYTIAGNSSQGDTVVRCESGGKWDYGDLRCLGVTCDDPFFAVGGYVTVVSYSMGSVATYNCSKDGYKPFPNNTRICIENKKKTGVMWSGEIPTCLDVQAPTLVAGTCMDSVTIQQFSLLNVTQPEFTDNSGSVNIAVQPEYISHDFIISSNLTVEYTATDSAGNNNTCTTAVFIEDNIPFQVSCAKDYIVVIENSTDSRNIIFNEDYIQVNESSNRIYSVTFEPPNIEVNSTFVGQSIKIQVVVSHGNKQWNCSFQMFVQAKGCSELSAPNVAFATKTCTTTGQSVECIYNCKSGYSFPNEALINSVTISCKPGSNWEGKLNNTACSAKGGNSIFTADIVLSYEVTNKSAVITQSCADQYQNNTIERLINGAEIVCSLVAHSPQPGVMENTFNTSVEGSKILIFGKITILKAGELKDKSQIACLEIFKESANTPLHVFHARMNISSSNDCGGAYRSGLNLTIHPDCPDGEFPIKETDANTYCFKCPVGSFVTIINDVTQCKLCPIGEYQDSEGNQTCISCPARTSTYSEGSVYVDDCKDVCEIGSISSTKLPPCTVCPMDTYYHNETYCESCPPLMKNRNYGSLSLSSCKLQCSEGKYSYDGFKPCTECSLGYYTNLTMQTMCLECPDGTTTLVSGATNITACVSVEANICNTNHCANNGICVPARHSYTCNCTKGFSGAKCEKKIDFCSSNPCYYNGNCTDKISTFECNCPAGTNGTQCEIIEKTCTPSMCLNDGICINKLNSFECHCPSGLTGKLCNESILPCDTNPCQNATCENLGNERAKCNCPAGYSGDKCEINIDDCASSPCLFNGTCVDLISGYKCQCPSGLSGKICSVRENPCNDSSCQGNVCILNKEAMNGICSCNEGYTYAAVCQLSYESSTRNESLNAYKTIAATSSKFCSTACLNDTQCVSVTFDNDTNSCHFFNDKINSSKDACCETFTKHCQNPTDNYWSPWYAINGSKIPENTVQTLRDVGIDVCNGEVPLLIQCRSADDRASFRWQQQLGMSFNLSDICIISNENCNSNCPPYQLRFQCAINKAMDQKQCFNKTTCDSMQCYNGGTCSSNMCTCTNDYKGEFCQTLNNNCDPNPCDGGSCINLVGDYQCNCFSGYEGKNCTKINNCTNVTCDATGAIECKDLVGDFECICKQGYKGKTCNINIDECTSNPCLHGANCTDLEYDFSCNCSAGWTGKRCENIESICQADTCSNSAQCIDLFQAYYCSCKSNTYGNKCETFVSVCTDANPCINNATCIDKIADTLCNCTEGFTGVGCALLIDYCKNTVCKNGGKCISQENGFECKCPIGVSGDHCETGDICQKNAYCQTNKATNKCPLGFSGANCNKAVSLDHDLCFNLPDKRGMAVMTHPILLTDVGFSMSLWIKFDLSEDSGTFMNVFMLKSENDGTEKKVLLFRLSNTGMTFKAAHGSMVTKQFSSVKINDAKWHLVTLAISSADNLVKLRVDNFQSASASNQPIQSPFNQTLLFILGCHFDPITDTAVINEGFYGYLSQLNIYNKSFVFNKDYSKLASDPKAVLSNMVYGWGNYYLVQGVRKIIPSNIIKGVSSSPNNKIPVSLKSCPSTVHNYGSESSILLNWESPVFSDYSEIKENYRSGSLVPWGRYFVTYQAKDIYGNVVFCNFKVYAKHSNCSEPEIPPHGSYQCNYQSWPYYSCKMKCNSGRVPITETPYMYTCGPSGTWNPKDRVQPFLFSPCGETVTPLHDISMKLSYNLRSTGCNSAKTAMLIKLKATMTNLSADSNNILCQYSDCRNVIWNITCTELSSANLTLDVYVELKNISTPAPGNASMTAEEILRKAGIDDLKFNYPEYAPGAIVIQNSFEINPEKNCKLNQSFINDFCVICPLGTYFNANQKMCEKCPIGSYQDENAMTTCKLCPNAKTTITTGSRNLTSCEDSCEKGYYFDIAAKNCTPCDTNSYQNETSQFVCKPCPSGRSTTSIGSTSETECSVTCPAGFERTTNCTPCNIGYYRKKNITVNTCQQCQNNTITLTTGSTSAVQCNITACIAGQYLEVSNNTCILCPKGTYQNKAYQTSCINCSSQYRSDILGAQDIGKCKFFCESGFESKGVICRSCTTGRYKDNSEDFYGLCKQCPIDYTTRAMNSTSIKDCNLYKCSRGEQPNANQTGCELCPPGTYQPDYEKESCIPCNASYSTNSAGSLTEGSCEGKTCCTYCESGYEKVASNSQKCSPCKIGFYKNNSNGLFSPCSKCPNGKITITKASVSGSNCTITFCTVGFYINNNMCIECPLNQFQNQTQQTSCLPCPPNTKTWKSGSASCIRDCPEGEQSNGAGVCVNCSIGTYRPADNATCIQCPFNFLTTEEGKTSEADCVLPPCNEGTYFNGSTCLNCILDKYQDQKHQKTCKSCPSGKYTSTDGKSCQSYCKARKPSCTKNSTCVDTSSGYKCVCFLGYVISNTSCIHTCDTAFCLNGGTCARTASKPICMCSKFYKGSNCQQEIAAAAVSDNTTQIIIGAAIGVTVAILLILLIVTYLCIRLRSPHQRARF